VDLKEILRRQDVVAKLVEDSIGRDRLREEGLAAFRGLDIDSLGYKLSAIGRAAKEGGNLGSTSKALECLYKLHLFADKCLPHLLDALGALVSTEEEEGQQQESENNDGKDKCALKSSFEGLSNITAHLGRAVDLAEKVIDFDAAPRDFIVNRDMDENLGDVKEELDGVQGELEAIHAEMNDLWSNVSGQGNNQVRLEDVDTNSNTSCVWQFRLPKTNDSKLLQENSQLKNHGVKVHRILKNGVYFTTKELTQLGTKKKDLMTEYEEKQRGIVVKCMEIAATYVPVLESASTLLAELDVLTSFAHVAAYSGSGYCRPEMTDGEEDGLGITVSCILLLFVS
jgi:DNA mismatch repair protein MSH2